MGKQKRPHFNEVRPFENGVPKGSRTPVTAVKGRCPRPLDDGDNLMRLSRGARIVSTYGLLSSAISNFVSNSLIYGMIRALEHCNYERLSKLGCIYLEQL